VVVVRRGKVGSVRRYKYNDEETGFVWHCGITRNGDLRLPSGRIDPYHVRLGPQGFLYITDVEGLNRPVVFSVDGFYMGQLGVSFGMLATPQFLAFQPGAYAPNCNVTPLPPRLSAGEELSFQVTVRDSMNVAWDGPVSINVDVTGVIILSKRITRISFPGDIEPVTESLDGTGSISSPGVYRAFFSVEASSLAYSSSSQQSNDLLVSPELTDNGFQVPTDEAEAMVRFGNAVTISLNGWKFLIGDSSKYLFILPGEMSAARSQAIGSGLDRIQVI